MGLRERLRASFRPLQPEGQRAYFAFADSDRARWVLDTPGVRRHEAALAASMPLGADPILDVGAGEGLLPRLLPELCDRAYVGVDLSVDRARAVRGREGLAATAADACGLPFADGSFGTIICRDVLHHLEPEARAHAVAEMARVLRDDGVCIITEPNAGRSPVMAAFSMLVSAERMALRFGADYLEQLVAPHFLDVTTSHHDASLLYRVLYHYRFGAPALAGRPLVESALQAWESTVGAAMPPRFSGFARVVCRKPDHGA